MRLATNGAMPRTSRGATRASSSGEARELVDVGVGLAGQPQHHVELEPRHAVRARQLRGAQQVALLGLALDDVAHPLGRAVGRGGQRAVAAALQQADDLVVEPVGAQAGDADLAARVDDRAQDLGQPRVVGDRGADQPHAARVVRDQRHDLLGRDQPHAAVGRAAHHAVGAAAVAAALRLDQEHVGAARCSASGSASAPAGRRRARRRSRAAACRAATGRRTRGAPPGRRAARRGRSCARIASTSSGSVFSASPIKMTSA